MLTTFSDESHIANRSLTSTRSSIFRRIVEMSAFNVLMSGTMFPLGPTKDGRGIIENCFGRLHKDTCKLPLPMRRAFERLFESPGDISITKFRILVSQFYIRRDDRSSWNGRWIISRAVQLPVPFLMPPHPDEFSSEELIQQSRETAAFKSLQKRMGKNLTTIMDRADSLRFLAWHPCYVDIERRIKGSPAAIRK